MKRWPTWLAVAATALLALTLAQTAAAADPPSVVLGADGKTAPVFSYANAIRERVFIPVAGIDQDADGITDRVAIDIIRPLESNSGLKVPAIIDDSPYYSSLGRGNDGEFIHTTPAGVLDKFPLFYDNYFVPRGYAVILAQAVGTAFSTGCPLHGGPGDVAGFKAVIDWLQGRVQGFDAVSGGNLKVADWDNGKAAMIGKSYDGTFANGVAATGVDGLTTIVPISAISDWYDYSREGGIRFNSHYPAFLSDAITENRDASVLGVVPPDRNVLCAPTRTAMSAVDGDDTGDINDFWNARDYNKDVASVHAAVFASHGINDNNVRPDHFARWWAGLAANNVPHKVWLSLEGHVDPFEYRRAAWVDTLHRWFDYWLQGVPNGIMNEPRATIETSKDVFTDYANWPLPGTKDLSIYLRGTAAGAAGKVGLIPGGTTDSLTFTDQVGQSENTMINNPTGSQANRLVFLSPVLANDLRLSGTPIVDIQASLNKSSANLGALIVDYGAGTHVTRSGDGVATLATEDCWGDSFGNDDGCYRQVTKPTVDVTVWRVSKGILDAQNRDSLFAPTLAVPGVPYEFRYPVLPTDYVFPAGHQIGIILVSNYAGFGSVTNTTSPTAVVTVDTKQSKVSLPVVGGYPAALASGAFGVPLDELLDNATGVGPGKSLANSVKEIKASVAAGDTRAACKSLDAFINKAKAQSGKTLTAAQADLLIAEAAQLSALYGC